MDVLFVSGRTTERETEGISINMMRIYARS